MGCRTCDLPVAVPPHLFLPVEDVTSGRVRVKLQWKEDSNGCWICTSHRASGKTCAYAKIWKDGKTQSVHVFMYEQCFGFVPEGSVVRHTCNNPLCINPEHLKCGTPEENTRDRKDAGTWPSGERNPMHKLTLHQVESIRKSKESRRALRERYSMSKSQIGKIIGGTSWSE